MRERRAEEERRGQRGRGTDEGRNQPVYESFSIQESSIFNLAIDHRINESMIDAQIED
jgi:hypothetical protein